MPETASCTASCQCCTGLCSPSGLCELVGAQEYSVGARFSVQLPGIEGTGYMWTVAPLPPAVVQVGDATSACNPSALGTPVVGCADTTTFLFEAEAPGQGTLTFAYARPWMADVAPLKTYQTAVRVY
jgi:predicted secreted protein